MSAAPDAELMNQAASGDFEAIAVLYDRHAGPLLGVALRIVGTLAEAEDVLHDVFVSLPRRAKHYTPARGSVRAWLVVLVRNLGIDRIRRHGRAVRVLHTPEAGPRQGDALPDPESDLTTATESEGVRRALAALPIAQRAALEAAFFEGLTYAEIAARDGVPLNTIKSRCARGIMALREALARVGIDGAQS